MIRTSAFFIILTIILSGVIVAYLISFVTAVQKAVNIEAYYTMGAPTCGE